MTTQINSDRMQDIECIVDLHKTAHGFKPRGDSFARLLQMSDREIARYIEDLAAEAEEALDYEKRMEAQALKCLEDHLQTLMGDYGIDQETAIRWEMDAHDCEDREHWLYIWGIGFDDMHRFM